MALNTWLRRDHSEAQLVSALVRYGFAVTDMRRLPSPSSAPNKTNDLVMVAVKG